MNETEIRWQVRSCYGKRRYPSEDAAKHMVKLINKQRPITLNVYACPVCQGFHLTSRTDN